MSPAHIAHRRAVAGLDAVSPAMRLDFVEHRLIPAMTKLANELNYKGPNTGNILDVGISNIDTENLRGFILASRQAVLIISTGKHVNAPMTSLDLRITRDPSKPFTDEGNQVRVLFDEYKDPKEILTNPHWNIAKALAYFCVANGVRATNGHYATSPRGVFLRSVFAKVPTELKTSEQFDLHSMLKRIGTLRGVTFHTQPDLKHK